MAYDVIGDVHGQDGKLEQLLQRMGYVAHGRGYKAPQGRQAVFLGDLIDRGSGQVRVVEIARAMVESGDARCIMGNHEFNAIAYVSDDPKNPAEALRPNRLESPKSHKNRHQHAAFLTQVGSGSALHRSMIDWFKTLPVFLDLGGIRVAHGCWDEASVQTLSAAGWDGHRPLSDSLLQEACRMETAQQESALMRARKLLTCGLELNLPEGVTIEAKNGEQFDNVRIANWRYWAKAFHEVALVSPRQAQALMHLPWPDNLTILPIEGAPIFLGHHWFSGQPVIECPKLACLDWSAALSGPLVSYRWDGEETLSNSSLIWTQ
jgi:hypothetical protein